MAESMFEPYREDIENCLESGLTIGETYKKLFNCGGYTMSNFKYYCRSRGLSQKEKNRHTSIEGCVVCEYYGIIKPFILTNNRQNIRYCKKCSQQINPNTKTMPKWCPKLK